MQLDFTCKNINTKKKLHIIILIQIRTTHPHPYTLTHTHTHTHTHLLTHKIAHFQTKFFFFTRGVANADTRHENSVRAGSASELLKKKDLGYNIFNLKIMIIVIKHWIREGERNTYSLLRKTNHGRIALFSHSIHGIHAEKHGLSSNIQLQQQGPVSYRCE
jgi:hypothetical protein